MNFLKKMTATFLVAALPVACFSQAKGIHFQEHMSWKSIQALAKSQHKYIFVDCYATWCVPCKLMDKDVYTVDSVGNFMNKNFIAIKVQMDVAKADGPETKKWYADAKLIKERYNIDAFPTLLFFSPQGTLVHEGLGGQDPGSFLTLSRNALNPKWQYFTLLNKYNKGIKDTAAMPYLSVTAIGLEQKDISSKIAADYINNYLAKLADDQLFTRDKISFLRAFTSHTTDKGFQLLYQYPEKVDAVMKDSLYAEAFVEYTIASDLVNPLVITASKNKASTIDWDSVYHEIQTKFSKSYADRVIAYSKALWYRYKKQVPLYLENIIVYTQLSWPKISDMEVNYTALDIFNDSTDPQQINSAINWMEKVVKRDRDSSNLLPASMDTYAGLLYKAGRKEQALQVEENALELAKKYKVDNFQQDFTLSIEKMKKDEPTWQVPTQQ